ncbi:MAG: hypothetical protein HKM05_01200 [Spirochaetales bacterium]|nr:hypothetical protein [Spirochaetales bacterium]
MKKIVTFLMLSVMAVVANAQVASSKQDVAIFQLSSADRNIPMGLMQGVDSQIQKVFVDLGRFTVLGLNFRLDGLNLQTFVSRLRLLKEQTTAPDKAIQFGETFLTLDEYNKIVGSFLVVIPRVDGVHFTRLANNVRKATIETSFTILKGSDLTPVTGGFFTVRSQGQAQNRQQALEQALAGIVPLLTFEVRKVPQFQISSGLVDVGFDSASMELGQNMGIMLGDEYALEKVVTKDGVPQTEETGLAIVDKVNPQTSRLFIAYGDPFVGQSVHEIPRLGVDLEPYANLVERFTDAGTAYHVALGVKGVLSRGFWLVKPMVGVEVPLILDITNVFWVPFYAYAGVEFYPFRLGRFELATSAALAMGGAYIMVDTSNFLGSNAQPYYLTHLGVRADAKAQFLFSRDAKLAASVGVAAYAGLLDAFVDKSSFFKSSAQISAGLSFVQKF